MAPATKDPAPAAPTFRDGPDAVRHRNHAIGYCADAFRPATPSAPAEPRAEAKPAAATPAEPKPAEAKPAEAKKPLKVPPPQLRRTRADRPARQAGEADHRQRSEAKTALEAAKAAQRPTPDRTPRSHGMWKPVVTSSTSRSRRQPPRSPLPKPRRRTPGPSAQETAAGREAAAEWVRGASGLKPTPPSQPR